MKKVVKTLSVLAVMMMFAAAPALAQAPQNNEKAKKECCQKSKDGKSCDAKKGGEKKNCDKNGKDKCGKHEHKK